MADDVNINEGTGTTVPIAADEIGGVKHQRVKVQHGADGSATDVSTASPLPVSLPAATVTTLTPPAAITGFATEATLDAIQTAAIAHLATLVAGIPADPTTATLQSAAIAHLASLVAAIGDPVDVASIAVPGTIYHGQTAVTTPGTAVALAASQALLSGVTVKALAANTGDIFVGANPVTSSTGFELAAGEQIFLEISNLATIFVDASVAGEAVSWIGS